MPDKEEIDISPAPRGQPVEWPLSPVTTAVSVDPAELKPTLASVARQAGGEGFVLTAGMQDTVVSLLPAIAMRISPRYAFAIHRLAAGQASRFTLANGLELPFDREAGQASPVGLAAMVCTLGQSTDGLSSALGGGSNLDVWLADAVLLAALELLEQRCLEDVAARAAAAGLCVGPAIVPAVAGAPQAAQDTLFACLDAATAGVALTEVGAMSPLKSFSCWLPLVPGPAGAAGALDLCARCDLVTCAFRRSVRPTS